MVALCYYRNQIAENEDSGLGYRCYAVRTASSERQANNVKQRKKRQINTIPFAMSF